VEEADNAATLGEQLGVWEEGSSDCNTKKCREQSTRQKRMSKHRDGKWNGLIQHARQ
jgi:hypothetical protein